MMRRWRTGTATCALCAVGALLVLACGGAGAQAADPYAEALDLERTFTDIYQRVEPAIVTVFAETAELTLAEKIKLGGERMPQGLGSGFIVDKRGYLITNEHVIREGEKFSVLLSDWTKYEGRIVGKDQLLDIALVKIELPDDQKGREFPTVRLGNSDAVRAGMWTVAIGNPIGYIFDDAEPVMSVGTVSGINRTFVRTLEDRREGMRTYGGLIQTDAVINPGNSGGPLLNIRGEAIGVNTLLWSPTGYSIGIGFAVPINTVRNKVPLLAKGYGVKEPMRYGTIDAQVETLNELFAEVLHIKGRRGVYVRRVVEGGAAAVAGVRDKDVIFKVNGRSVVNDAQLISLVAHLPIGQAVPFEISRVVENKPKTMIVNITLNGKTIKEIEAAARPPSGSE